MLNKLHPIVTLMLICAISSLAILNIEKTTKVYILKQQQENILAGYKEVFPELGEIKKIDTAKDNKLINELVASVVNGEINGYIYTVKPEGYSGAIITMLAFDIKENKITGIKILSQRETPGLGAKCKEKPFTDMFVGKTAKQPLNLVKTTATNNDIQAITAATITSKAIVNGINIARTHFESLVLN